MIVTTVRMVRGGMTAFGLATLMAAVAAGRLEAQEDSPRTYLSGIVGASFMTLSSGGENTLGSFDNTGSMTGTAFTGGGAIGRAIPAGEGQWRIEAEGRQRARLAGETNSFPPTGLQYAVQAADGWSVLANAWRDIPIGERFDIYLGGGIGGGGYRLFTNDGVVQGYNRVGEFAWQAGGGGVWNVNDRLAIDLGYRFFAIGTGSTALSEIGIKTPSGAYTSALSASELLLTFRVYEPFAVLRR